jgi:hypothetical protein
MVNVLLARSINSFAHDPPPFKIDAAVQLARLILHEYPDCVVAEEERITTTEDQLHRHVEALLVDPPVCNMDAGIQLAHLILRQMSIYGI